MRAFLKFLEVARSRPHTLSPDNDPHILEFGDQFWDAMEECQPFVFQRNGLTIDPDNFRGEEVQPETFPFKYFCMEFSDGYVASPRPDDERKYWIDCVVVRRNESERGGYGWIILLHDEHGQYGIVDNAQFQKAGITGIPSAIDVIIANLTNRLDSAEFSQGTEDTNVKVKLGTGKTKRHHRIRRVVHVVPRKETKQYAQSLGKSIDYSHRWWSRGHWAHFWLRDEEGRFVRDSNGNRVIDRSRLGKNADGDYVERGRTWKSECIKGPEDKPLIRKTRVVRGKSVA